MFRELGHPAAFVYEALEHIQGRPERSFDLVTRTGLSRTAVYEALETLAAWNLVEPRDGRWVLVPGTSLQQLAEQFGCADTVRALLNRHRDERARYRRALRIVDQHHVPALEQHRGVPVATGTTTRTRRPCSSCWNASSAPTPSPSARNHGQVTSSVNRESRHAAAGGRAGDGYPMGQGIFVCGGKRAGRDDPSGAGPGWTMNAGTPRWKERTMKAKKGDWLVVESSAVDRSSRRGLVLDRRGPGLRAAADRVVGACAPRATPITSQKP